MEGILNVTNAFSMAYDYFYTSVYENTCSLLYENPNFEPNYYGQTFRVLTCLACVGMIYKCAKKIFENSARYEAIYNSISNGNTCKGALLVILGTATCICGPNAVFRALWRF